VKFRQVAVALAVLVAACGTPVTTATDAVIDLVDVDQLATDFNRAAASGPVLLLLLSPT
jgi:hypothetical protein